MVLEIFSELFHSCHICKQDCLHHSLSDKLNFLLGELSAQKIVIVDIEELDTLSCMEVFLHMLLSVHLAQWRLCNDMVSVVIAVMLHVVAKCRHYERQCVEIVKMSMFSKSLITKNQINMLSDIWAVHIVMVFHRSFVLVIDLGKKLQELMVIYHLDEIIFLQQWCSHKWHLHVTTNSTWEFEDVKLVWAKHFIIHIMVSDQFLYVLTGEVEVDPVRVYLHCPEVIVPLKTLLLFLGVCL